MINLALFGYGGQEYFREVVQACLREVHDRKEIRVKSIEDHPEGMFRYAEVPEVHGVLAPSMSAAELAWFQERGIQVVFYSSRLPEAELPSDVGRVCADDMAIGALAARHFKRVGLARAGFFGMANTQFAVDREKGFRRAWGEGPYSACMDGNKGILEWLKGLSAPMGIFCDQDHHAKNLIQEALKVGFRIPEDLVVVGVDAELMVSELSPVRITSVELDAHSLAFRALEVLVDCVTHCVDPGGIREVIAPKGLVYRDSAPFHYSTRPEVNQVLRWMEERLDQRFRMEDLARQAGMSRRTLETRFQETMGVSPYQKLLEIRLGRARQLLLQTNLTMSEIAEQCGFTNAREFSVRFKSKQGIPPRVYRERS